MCNVTYMYMHYMRNGQMAKWQNGKMNRLLMKHAHTHTRVRIEDGDTMASNPNEGSRKSRKVPAKKKHCK